MLGKHLESKAPKPEDEPASAAKAEKLRNLQSQFLCFHHNNIYSKEALEVNAKLLEINPEYYTAWNYRKLAVEHRLTQSESDPDSVNSILNEELKVVWLMLSFYSRFGTVKGGGGKAC